MPFICNIVIKIYLLRPKLWLSGTAFKFYEAKESRKWGQNEARCIYLGFSIPNKEYFGTLMFLSCFTHSGGSIES